ncbi:hypothetical protein G6O69_33210 [Pseudenhygromyxa sp. WMMC2535]|uniref:hypothetical protein n=1 Tax=Pseudenhygromyxa sp. WMMC2535 TaxID=2712867 RepID=UPI001552D27B|nr:hypothetical protein [Pseudenhygromyxa sp. WMMC2535]NVB42728.1 hypothetical protein [Pseudenhygromyxa sp. WMMC2535]
MAYWSGGYVQDLLIIISLLAVAVTLRKAISPLQRLGMPDALLAGAMAMLLGPSGLELLPFSSERLEAVIYHLLALIFIAISLQSPPPGKRSGTVRSIAFAVPAIATLQGVVGLLCVFGWNLAAGGPELHTGFAMLLPLGFNQGPGPAMTLGGAWEGQAGLAKGAQLGLIMAALGYMWCCVMGVALVVWGRRMGWDRAPGRLDAGLEAQTIFPERPPAKRALLGELEPMTAQLIAMAIVYLMTWQFLVHIGGLLPAKHQPTLYGFHFLLATGFGLLLRPVAGRLPGGSPLDNDLLARIGSAIIDLATCAALAAVRIEVLIDFLAPVLLITTAGGLTTLFACVWMARRAFPTAPFHHAVVAFGALTGTATTGLALLRMLDPQLEGPTARNYVLAVTPSALLGLPLFVLMPICVLGFPGDYPGKALVVLGILLGYLALLFVAWRFTSPLRFLRPLTKVWPPLPDDPRGPAEAPAE